MKQIMQKSAGSSVGFQEKRFIVDILFVLTLFGVFALSSLILVTVGAQVYQNTVDDMSANFESRTSISYITEKVRQNDIYDSISIGELQGTDALVLTQVISGTEYCTYLYYHDGSLKELFMKKGGNIGDDMLIAGQPVMELAFLQMENLSDSLLRFALTTPDGKTTTLYISLKSR